MENLGAIGPQQHAEKLADLHAGWLGVSQTSQICERIGSQLNQACSYMVSRLIFGFFSGFGINLLNFGRSKSAGSLPWLNLTFEGHSARRTLWNRANQYARSHLEIRLEVQVFLTLHVASISF